MLEDFREFAIEQAKEAGAFALAELDSVLHIEHKGSPADLVTHVDIESERRIVSAIQTRYPGHAILAEESGHHAGADMEFAWLVDPLDGTNNYALGIPMFGVCLTLCSQGKPVVAVVHDSVRGRTTSAIVGRGARDDDGPLSIGPAPDLAGATVSWVQGYGVEYDDLFRIESCEILERHAKRMIRTWSPSIDWGLLARGEIAALVAYRNAPWDLLGGLLIAQEAGAVSVTTRDCVVAGHRETVAHLTRMLPIDRGSVTKVEENII